MEGYIVEALNKETKKGYMVRIDAELINVNLTETMKKALDSENYDEKISINSMK